MVPVYVHGGLPNGASRICTSLLNNDMAQLFPFSGAAGLTNCWHSVFLDGFGPTAKWPWAHHVLPAALWCCLPTSQPPPSSHLQSAGVSAHPDRTTSLAPFCPAKNGLQTDKVTFPKLVDFSGITSGFNCKTDRVGMCSEDHWCASGELWGNVALLTLLYNLVPSTTPLTCSFSRRHLTGPKKQWKWEHCHDPEVQLQLF